MFQDNEQFEESVDTGIVTGFTAGIVLGIIDAVWALLRLDPEAYTLQENIFFGLLSAILVGAAGLVVGGALGAAKWYISTSSWSYEIPFVSSRLTWPELRALIFGATGATAALLFRNYYWPAAHISADSVYEVAGMAVNVQSFRRIVIIALSIALFAGVFALFRRDDVYGFVKTHILRGLDGNLTRGKIAWLAIILFSTLLAGRFTYEASRLGPMFYVHSLVVVMTLGVYTAVVGFLLRNHRIRLTRRWVIAALVGAAILSPAMIGALTDHDTRLFLHERTAVTYRILSFNPGFGLAATRHLPALENCTDSEIKSGKGKIGDNDSRIDKKSDDRSSVDHVVVIMIDTLRTDRMGEKRDGVPVTKNLNRFADDAIEFSEAYTSSPATWYTVASMLSGHESALLEEDDDGSIKSDRSNLLSILNDEEIFTVSVPGHGHLENLTKKSELIFEDSYYRPDLDHNSPIVTNNALEGLEAAAQHGRSFTIVHYLDPHDPHNRPDDFDFGRSLESKYDAEIAFTDRHVGEVLDAIERKLPSETATIVVSDHGEEFWDHGYRFHAVRLYEESIQLVALMDLPDQDGGEVISTRVWSPDLMPTILDLYGIEIPDGVAGKSWLNLGRDQREFFLHSWEFERIGLLDGQYKFIVNRTANILELYDLEQDPRELDNLADHRPKLVKSKYCRVMELAEERFKQRSTLQRP